MDGPWEYDNYTWVNVTTPAPHEWWMPQTTPLTPEQWHERVQTSILYTFFSSCGVVFNALPILLTFCTEMRYNNVHIMVAALSSADLLCSLTFPFGQNIYILYREQVNFIGCRILGFLTFTTSSFEFMFPPFLSVNRYVSLYHSQHYDRIYTTKNVTMMVIGTWVFCTIVPFIFLMCGQAGFDDDNGHCCIVVKYSHWAWSVFYWAVIIVPLVCFCDGTMMYCNFKIYKKLREHSAAQTLKNNVMKQNRELFYFLVADMTFPIIFHTTYHVAKFVSPNRTSLFERRIFTCLYLTNSSVRGLVTLCMLRPYRRAVKKLLCFCKSAKSTSTVGPVSIGASSVVGGPGTKFTMAASSVRERGEVEW